MMDIVINIKYTSGTLAGDALLHLLPHAMSEVTHGAENDYDSDGPDPHTSNTWKGLAAMMGLTFFFIMERLIMVASKYRKKKQKDTSVSVSKCHAPEKKNIWYVSNLYKIFL